MAQVTIDINGKHYPLACANGEEAHLQKLADYVDSKVRDLGAKLGHVSEARLMLMAALIITDELNESTESKGGSSLIGALSENDMASVLNEVANEVEAIAEKLISA